MLIIKYAVSVYLLYVESTEYKKYPSYLPYQVNEIFCLAQ